MPRRIIEYFKKETKENKTDSRRETTHDSALE
jgi:hypothetical protein